MQKDAKGIKKQGIILVTPRVTMTSDPFQPLLFSTAMFLYEQQQLRPLWIADLRSFYPLLCPVCQATLSLIFSCSLASKWAKSVRDTGDWLENRRRKRQAMASLCPAPVLGKESVPLHSWNSSIALDASSLLHNSTLYIALINECSLLNCPKFHIDKRSKWLWSSNQQKSLKY